MVEEQVYWMWEWVACQGVDLLARPDTAVARRCVGMESAGCCCYDNQQHGLQNNQ